MAKRRRMALAPVRTQNKVVLTPPIFLGIQFVEVKLIQIRFLDADFSYYFLEIAFGLGSILFQVPVTLTGSGGLTVPASSFKYS